MTICLHHATRAYLNGGGIAKLEKTVAEIWGVLPTGFIKGWLGSWLSFGYNDPDDEYLALTNFVSGLSIALYDLEDETNE